MSLPPLSLASLDSPSLLLNLDVLDKNLQTLSRRLNGKKLRVHFKSMKCGQLASYLMGQGIHSFLCAKLNEAEVLAAAGVKDIFIANQLVGKKKLARLAALTKKAQTAVLVDCDEHINALAEAAREHGVRLSVLVEVEIGMNRCGAFPGEPVINLVQKIVQTPGLQFVGLQGYDGHLQLCPDKDEQRQRALAGMKLFSDTRRELEKLGIAVPLVTGGGTGTFEYALATEGVDEIQPGSFLLMDAIYSTIRPEFEPSLTVLATVISRRPGLYILDAGTKAISKDFCLPTIKGKPDEKVIKLSEEHTRVECTGPLPEIGETREVITGHCCGTMNLHREVVAIRNQAIVGKWPVEASGRYD